MAETIEGCARAGVEWIGLWRHKVDEIGIGETARRLSEAGLKVSSLCRGGFFPAATSHERQHRIEDNLRALDEAAQLGAGVLVLVCGPAPDRDLDAARQMVEDGIRAVVPHAAERGIRLAIEPLHPMYAGDRSVVVTLAQANAMAERIASPLVGVAVDVYHVWWDPEVYDQIARAGENIVGFHVSDWLVPPPDHLLGRGMMGDGIIQLRRIREAVEAAGYEGPIEVEIFNQHLWDMPGEQVLELMKERFGREVM
ncbi:MAG: sugar phosphate isomerase/epimerase [Chloroflexota bacterium]|nr:sugar phosphate isomerase/epimerase [Chloroflexota bacterium]